LVVVVVVVVSVSLCVVVVVDWINERHCSNVLGAVPVVIWSYESCVSRVGPVIGSQLQVELYFYGRTV